MATVAEKLLTAEEFARLPNPPDGSKQELVKGEIVIMPPPGFEHGDIQLTIGSLLKQFALAQRLGRVTVESGVITEQEPDSVRGPDIAFWSKDRLPLDQPRPKGYPDVAPDLCVEVISPNYRPNYFHDKIREYFTCGVRMVWIVDPNHRTVTVYRTPEDGRLLDETATLSGEDVLPGFSCKVAEFFT